MKRTLTLLILLFAFLRLLAATGNIDTINLSATNVLNNGDLPLLVLHPEKLLVWTKSNNIENLEPVISPFITNVLKDGDLPLLVLHPEKLMVWTKSNHSESIDQSIPPAAINNVLNKGDLLLLILHPEKFIVWTKLNSVDSPEPIISPFIANVLSSRDLPLLVLHPEKLIACITFNRTEDSELSISPFIANVSNTTDLPLLILRPEKLVTWTRSNHTESLRAMIWPTRSDSLKLPVVPFHPVVILKPPTAAPHLQSFKQQIKLYDLDSLKSLAKTTANDSLKALLFTEIANRYLDNDTISDKKILTGYQTEALSYSMKALHLYSRYGDTTGLRMSYDNLAKVYFSQKKYVQAKWFILQSNYLSRAQNDVPNVIASLLTLSAIKSEINDDKLAMRDLDEALQLSITKHYPKIELDVLKNYALYYSQLQNYPKEALMLKKRDSLQENIRKKEEAALLAKVALQDSIQKKKVDSLNKKKVYTSNTRKLYKSASAKKMASL